MTRPAGSAAESTYDILNVHGFQLINCDVNPRQPEQLGHYIDYVESVGGEKPTEGEVVGAPLAELFKLNRGFQEWKEQHHEPHVRADEPAEITPRAKG